mmetsp:Transcript_955/g.1187  ORF Transcript_955/g.1187 Transcript_955/m.1187 type:complete len:98 (-) Transcript_955:244-537(-)
MSSQSPSIITNNNGFSIDSEGRNYNISGVRNNGDRREISRNLHRLKRRMFLQTVQQEQERGDSSFVLETRRRATVRGLRSVIFSAVFEETNKYDNMQ